MYILENTTKRLLNLGKRNGEQIILLPQSRTSLSDEIVRCYNDILMPLIECNMVRVIEKSMPVSKPTISEDTTLNKGKRLVRS